MEHQFLLSPLLIQIRREPGQHRRPRYVVKALQIPRDLFFFVLSFTNVVFHMRKEQAPFFLLSHQPRSLPRLLLRSPSSSFPSTWRSRKAELSFFLVCAPHPTSLRQGEPGAGNRKKLAEVALYRTEWASLHAGLSLRNKIIQSPN